MGRGVRALLVSGTAAAALVVALPTASASAAPADGTGIDVSHPQCGEPLPDARAFGVVGVNGGRATLPNPCLETQLAWAHESTGEVDGHPPVQLYLNTANPGEVRELVTTWPSSGDTPYGECDGSNSTACSWEYGWERARTSVTEFFVPAARAAGVEADPAAYTWWLDVEDANTWQSGSPGAQARNRATLEGMAAYLTARGGTVGLYAVPQQWREIAGAVAWDSSLYRLDSWLPGAVSADGAEENCADEPLTAGGDVVLAQYVRDGLDHNVPCR
ncbi:hypothetical protein [Geodermatophilus sp. SYSU D00815]